MKNYKSQQKAINKYYNQKIKILKRLNLSLIIEASE